LKNRFFVKTAFEFSRQNLVFKVKLYEFKKFEFSRQNPVFKEELYE